MMVHEYLLHTNAFWISVSLIACLFISLLSCVCGCRKKVPKNELLGLDGLVKITNPDENVNFSSVAASDAHRYSPNSGHRQLTEELTGESHNSSKRGSNAVATATRSLPDLPVDSGEAAEKLWGPTENNVDTNSDLYATVEDAGRKKRPLVSGLTVDSSYTPSQTDDSLSPYARLKGEHPYDQLKQNEHPYAQVGLNGVPGPSTSQDAVLNSPHASPLGGLEVDPDGSLKRSTPGGSSTDHIPEEIPAASAIAGSVPANQDLPYMTPPIVTSQQQLHFSGDSADSSKGYTSISVREPLSRILADRRRRGSGGGIDDSSNGARNCDSGGGIASSDPHYATVSDDSDEMYAAIEERHMSLTMEASRGSIGPSDGSGGGGGGGEYTSGSETYAQIAPLPPTASSSTNAVADSPPPPSRHPPNLSLVLHHQDSVSTCSSSDSPRRERRAANSPLPQVPLPTLDDMYAKVIKKGRTPTSPEPTGNGPPVLRVQDVDDDPSSLPGYETVSSTSSVVNLSLPGPSSSSTGLSNSVTSSSRSSSIVSQTGAAITTLNRCRSPSAMDPNYEELKCGPEPDYASLSRPSVGGRGYHYSTAGHQRDSRRRRENEDRGVYEDSPFGSLVDPNYERVGSDSGAGEPPYERLNNPSPELPDYEVVCNRLDPTAVSLSDLYAKVNKSEKQ